MTDRLSKGQQTILFLNRRGYAGFVSCRACGEVMKCPHCDVSLSEHKGGRLICHYCGYTQPLPKLCPKCGSKYILGFKAGTQQIEDKLKELYPGVRTLRMDADTTRTKDSYEKILSAFSNGEKDNLSGIILPKDTETHRRRQRNDIVSATVGAVPTDRRARHPPRHTRFIAKIRSACRLFIRQCRHHQHRQNTLPHGLPLSPFTDKKTRETLWISLVK